MCDYDCVCVCVCCTGIRLDLGLSLHNQGVVEQERVTLVVVGTGNLVSPLATISTDPG